MNFYVYGPFSLPRTKAGLIDSSKTAKKSFWSDIDKQENGLSSSCGVYVYCVSARRGTLPWYVGKTEKRAFADEAIADHQAKLYDQALVVGNRLKVGVTPCLFLLPLHTQKKWCFAKPSKQGRPVVKFLESYLIGLALRRNRKLLNSRDTRFLRNIYLTGILNSARGPLTTGARELKSVLNV